MDSGIRTRRDFLKAAGTCAASAALAGCVDEGPRPTLVQSQSQSLAQPATQAYYPAIKPNILWIICEDISPYLGCYGDPLAVTPNIDRLAGSSILYRNAFSTASVCSPSRSCLITGVYATSLGTQHARSEVPIPSQIEPFPKLLKAAGYYCSSNVQDDHNFRDPTIWDDQSPNAHWRNRGMGQPFFSIFNLGITHQSQINGSDEEFETRCGSKLKPEERHDPRKILLPAYYPDTPVVRKMWARYYDLITLMDKQIAGILRDLELDAVSENTVVFFFADHGMGLPRFKRSLYDSGLRVPLLVRVPSRYQNLTTYTPGGRTDQLVSFVDFAPTVLSLAGIPAQSYMQGQAFLGKATSPRNRIVASLGRIDESYDMSRCLRDKRYKYIRNFMPHLPYAQPSDYCDQAEIMQELRAVAAAGGMAGMEKLYWQPTKPVEELYDTWVDPNESRNLIDSPEHHETLLQMRKQLRDWMLETVDTGLLPEAEMHIRAAGSAPYDMVRNPAKFSPSTVLDVAELVGSDARLLPAMVESLSDSDSAVRYWAAIYFASLVEEAAPAADALKKLLDDPSPDVRFAAADALRGLGQYKEALPVLAQGLLDSRESVVLHAARTLQQFGDKAAPVVEEMEQARRNCLKPDGSYRNDNYAMFTDWALKHAIESCGQ